MREIENKEEWRSELGFGEGEQKFWVWGLILSWKIEIVFLADFFFSFYADVLKIMMTRIGK